jgi:serine/threonine protein kinase
MLLVAGRKLGPYEILGPLGAGGMGEVYRARDPVLGRDVAIKILPSFVSSDPEKLRRFEQEARAAAGLNHPNILAIFQMSTCDGVPYLVSELLQGETLRELL